MNKQMRLVLCLGLVALVALCPASPAQAKNNKNSGAQQAIKRVEEEIKAYEAKLKNARDRMKAAEEKGEEVEPLIEPAERDMRRLKSEMQEKQRERAQASRAMQDRIKADPGIADARMALEEAEDKRDKLKAKLMPAIESDEQYRKLAAKRDASEQWLAKCKREGRELDVPAAATTLARDQGALSTLVQARLSEDKAYQAVEAEVSKAQSARRATEREAAERYHRESGLVVIDAVYADKQEAYREARDKHRDLESKFSKARSDHRDAKADAEWAARRIALRKERIRVLQRNR